MTHFPPEWSPHEAVWIGFPSAADLWLDDLGGAQEQVAAFARAVHADGKGEQVRLVCANEAAADRAVVLAPGAQIMLIPFFDIWVRDTGPLARVSRSTIAAMAGAGNTPRRSTMRWARCSPPASPCRTNRVT
jgi:agmatine deiminase